MKTLLLSLITLSLTASTVAFSQAQGTDSQMQSGNIQGQDFSRDQGNGTTLRDDKQSMEENLPRRTSDEGNDMNYDDDQYDDSDEDLDADY